MKQMRKTDCSFFKLHNVKTCWAIHIIVTLSHSTEKISYFFPSPLTFIQFSKIQSAEKELPLVETAHHHHNSCLVNLNINNTAFLKSFNGCFGDLGKKQDGAHFTCSGEFTCWWWQAGWGHRNNGVIHSMHSANRGWRRMASWPREVTGHAWKAAKRASTERMLMPRDKM